MVDICYAVGYAHDLAFQCRGETFAGMVEYPVSHFKREVHSLSVSAALQHVDYAEALFVVPEAAGMYLVKDRFPVMPERGVSEIVAQCYGFREVLIKLKRPGYGPGDL